MRHRDFITIQKIMKEMRVGIEILGETDKDLFLNDETLKRALSMTCINVGELVKVITDETRKQYTSFPWKAVAGMRDIAAHRYQTLRMEDVFNTIHDEYPELMKELEGIISEANEENNR